MEGTIENLGKTAINILKEWATAKGVGAVDLVGIASASAMWGRGEFSVEVYHDALDAAQNSRVQCSLDAGFGVLTYDDVLPIDEDPVTHSFASGDTNQYVRARVEAGGTIGEWTDFGFIP